MTKRNYLIIFCILITKILPLYSQQVFDTLFISSAKELKTFSRNVNNGNTYQKTLVQLTQDIFLNDTTSWEQWDSVSTKRKEQWTPIGHMVDKDSIMAFQGTFDGKGHCIYGIYINRKSTGLLQGFFGAIKNATVRNLSIKASVITGYLYVGGIVAYMGGTSTINNCHNFGKITGIRNQVGGVVASLNAENTESSASIINCSNSGNLRGKCIVGGIVGSIYTSNKIKGSKKENRPYGLGIYNCFNKGEISGYRDVGGIAGLYLVEVNSNKVDTIANCYNTGNIFAQFVAGGICGTYKIYTYKAKGYGKPSLSNCYNAGIVSIIYSTATDFLVGNLNSLISISLAETMPKHNAPCYNIIQANTILRSERKLLPALTNRFVNVSSPSHFYTLSPEDMQSDSFVNKLNGFVGENSSPYKKWQRDTKGTNGGFPIFVE